MLYWSGPWTLYKDNVKRIEAFEMWLWEENDED